ncbi:MULTISPECIES: hypothetical protein [Bacillus]|uniref:hypothetical protein n=1 Tax=Bacillus TaxID=1386 RepID=UPI00031D110C|nr:MULTISPECIES: hypothetical protein [Bacillus]
MKKITTMLLLLFVLAACSNENSTEVKKEENDNVTTEQVEKKKITKEFVKKNAKVGLSYNGVREIFGTEQYSGIMDNTMTFIYDSTSYKPVEYDRLSGSVAFDDLKSGNLDYQLWINFVEKKAVYYQYYFEGEDGEVWGYTVSSDGDNLTRNSGN